MDFTREPIIETVITPKAGCKLVVRSSKSSAQEEYFVDAVEVVSFGNSFFFRSLERPKAFLVPASDYEILEVREARMVLKNVGLDRSIKIGGGREQAVKAPKEVDKVEQQPPVEAPAAAEAATEGRVDKKRDRRSRYRRRRGREETVPKEGTSEEAIEEGEKIELAEPRRTEAGEESGLEEPIASPASPLLSSLLPPPPTLISETIARYKDNAMFRGAFFLRDEEKEGEEGEEGKEAIDVPLAETHLSPFEMTESEQEFYKERATQFTLEAEPYQPPLEEKPSGVVDEPADTNGNH